MVTKGGSRLADDIAVIAAEELPRNKTPRHFNAVLSQNTNFSRLNNQPHAKGGFENSKTSLPTYLPAARTNSSSSSEVAPTRGKSKKPLFTF